MSFQVLKKIGLFRFKIHSATRSDWLSGRRVVSGGEILLTTMV